jgi:hypothetical protein
LFKIARTASVYELLCPFGLACCCCCCSFGCEPDLPLVGCMSMKQLLSGQDFAEHVRIMDQPIRGEAPWLQGSVAMLIVEALVAVGLMCTLKQAGHVQQDKQE